MGFQIQNDLPTIELKLMEAFKKLLNCDVKIYASGRTDRFVHAIGQVFHVDLDNEIIKEKIKPKSNLFRGSI